MAAWKKLGAMQWGANVGRIRGEIHQDGAGKFRWRAFEQLPPHHEEKGTEDQLAYAKGAAEIFIRDHKKHTPWTHR